MGLAESAGSPVRASEQVPKIVEEALAKVLDEGGATGLLKVGLDFRHDASRRVVEQATFRHTERNRLERR